MRIAIVNKEKMDKLTIDNINLREQVKVEIENKNEWHGTASRRWDEILKMREIAKNREQTLLQSQKEIEALKRQVQRLTRRRNAQGKFVKQN